MKNRKKHNPNNNFLLRRQGVLILVLGLVNFAFQVAWEPTISGPLIIEPDTLRRTGEVYVLPPMPRKEKKAERQAVVAPNGPLQVVDNTDPIPAMDPGDLPDPTSFVRPHIDRRQEPEQERIVFENKEAEFPGGNEAIGPYLKSRLSYPDDAMELEIECNMVVNISLDKFGKVKEVRIVSASEEAYYFENQVIEAIYSMPNWTPAVYNNQFVQTDYVLSFSFVIEQ